MQLIIISLPCLHTTLYCAHDPLPELSENQSSLINPSSPLSLSACRYLFPENKVRRRSLSSSNVPPSFSQKAGCHTSRKKEDHQSLIKKSKNKQPLFTSLSKKKPLPTIKGEETEEKKGEKESKPQEILINEKNEKKTKPQTGIPQSYSSPCSIFNRKSSSLFVSHYSPSVSGSPKQSFSPIEKQKTKSMEKKEK